MTIEKTIELAREHAKKLREDIEFCVQKEISGCDECIHCDIPCIEQAEENEQIAEWLEELKVYQQHEIVCHKGYNAGYNKAIDDFVERLTTYLGIENATKYGNKNAEKMRNSYGTFMKYEIAESIECVAEQLKAGEKE